MQFGFSPPVSGPLSSPDNLARIASEGEAIGYDYATISDHVVIPHDIEDKYPYSDTGEFPGRARGDRHEQLTAVAFIAGKTSRLRLVTSVTVVPHRPAVLLAKMLATIDVLSKGRLTFGIGAGWMREEFEALGVPPFRQHVDRRQHLGEQHRRTVRHDGDRGHQTQPRGPAGDKGDSGQLLVPVAARAAGKFAGVAVGVFSLDVAGNDDMVADRRVVVADRLALGRDAREIVG